MAWEMEFMWEGGKLRLVAYRPWVPDEDEDEDEDEEDDDED